MRILVLSNLYPPVIRGGYEVECRDVVEHLSARHEVTVLASSLGRGEHPPTPGVLRALPWIGELRKRDAALATLYALRAEQVIARVLRRIRPDAIYIWNGAGVPATAVRALQRSGLPVLVRVCEYWFTTLYEDDPFTRYLPGGAKADAGGVEGAWGAATRLLNRLPGLQIETREPLPAAVCWNSRFVERAAPAPPGVAVTRRAIVIPSNARTTELPSLPRAPRPGRVLFVGRLDDRKGAATVVRALGRLPPGAAELVLVGEGSAKERTALERTAAEAGVTTAVRFTGPLRGPALEAEITAASAWCVPSIWEEPAPLTCTEAALTRVPAVFSRVGGIGEMFAEGTQALFHEPDDDAGCAAALADCLAGGPAVEARVEAAFARGRELSFGPYLAAMDAFLAESLADAGQPSRPSR